MNNTINWKRSKSDGCSILTSDCGNYEVRQNYSESIEPCQAIKEGYRLDSGTQKQCKDACEWDKKHN